MVVRSAVVQRLLNLRAHVPPVVSGKKGSVIYWTAEHFLQNSHGRNNIATFADDHESATGHRLLDDQGALLIDGKPEWAGLRLLVAGFFDKEHLTYTRAAKANAAGGVLSFSKWVFYRFQQLVPLPGKASRVAKFFTEVALAMPPPLRSCPLPN